MAGYVTSAVSFRTTPTDKQYVDKGIGVVNDLLIMGLLVNFLVRRIVARSTRANAHLGVDSDGRRQGFTQQMISSVTSQPVRVLFVPHLAG